MVQMNRGSACGIPRGGKQHQPTIRDAAEVTKAFEVNPAFLNLLFYYVVGPHCHIHTRPSFEAVVFVVQTVCRLIQHHHAGVTRVRWSSRHFGALTAIGDRLFRPHFKSLVGKELRGTGAPVFDCPRVLFPHMLSIMAEANSEHFKSVAPSVSRSKS